MLKKVYKGLKNPNLLFALILNNKLFRVVPDAMYLKIKYKLLVGKKLDLEKPKSFNEKLQWLKLNDRNPKYTNWVDKYEVRKLIAEKIGEEYLVPLLGVYDNFDEIDFDALPNQFVLKPNHTSGNVYICRDKSKIDYSQLKKEVNAWLKRQYYWYHREWPYKNIKPKIVCEKFMVDESGYELKDYKILCFNGNARCSFVGLNRESKNGLNVDFYDIDWIPMPFERHYPRSGKVLAKPREYNKMIHFAEILSENTDFLRVDFYEINGKLFFGELTFHPGSGYEKFTPESYDELLGSWIKLTN